MVTLGGAAALGRSPQGLAQAVMGPEWSSSRRPSWECFFCPGRLCGCQQLSGEHHSVISTTWSLTATKPWPEQQSVDQLHSHSYCFKEEGVLQPSMGFQAGSPALLCQLLQGLTASLLPLSSFGGTQHWVRNRPSTCELGLVNSSRRFYRCDESNRGPGPFSAKRSKPEACLPSWRTGYHGWVVVVK